MAKKSRKRPVKKTTGRTGPKLFGRPGERLADGYLYWPPGNVEANATIWREGSTFAFSWPGGELGNYDTERDAIRGLKRSIERAGKAAHRLGWRPGRAVK